MPVQNISQLDDIFDGLEDDNPPEGDPSKGPKEKPKEDAKAKFETLQKSYKDLQEHSRQQSEELKSLREKTEKIDQIANVFVGDDGEQKRVKAELSEREEFEKDSFAYNQRRLADMKKELEEKYSRVVDERIHPIQANAVFERCKNKISQKYEVDWEDAKVQKDISSQLERLDAGYRSKEPEKALLTAAHLSGHLRKRSADELPFTEMGGNFSTYNPKAAQREADQIKKNIVESGKKRLQLI
jgi:hypothetical protein